MAAAYLLSHPDVGGKLVHGTIGNEVLIAHAWVLLPGNKVFDGVLQMFLDAGSYHQGVGAKAERVYSVAEMVELIKKHGHWGPWHETSGAIGIGIQGYGDWLK